MDEENFKIKSSQTANKIYKLSTVVGKKSYLLFTNAPNLMAPNLSTMVGENFDIYSSQMAEYALELSTMVEENFEIYWLQMVKYARKLSIMVGENVEIYSSQMAKYTQIIHHVWRKFWYLLFVNG